MMSTATHRRGENFGRLRKPPSGIMKGRLRNLRDLFPRARLGSASMIICGETSLGLAIQTFTSLYWKAGFVNLAQAVWLHEYNNYQATQV